jgi:hypothetical protein
MFCKKKFQVDGKFYDLSGNVVDSQIWDKILSEQFEVFLYLLQWDLNAKREFSFVIRG